MLYPLVKGAGDFEACYLRLAAPDRTEPLLYTFVPNTGISKPDYQACETRLNSVALKKTKAWFKQFDALLDARSTYRRQMLPAGAPNQAVYNVGDYSFQKWKVIWPEMSTRFYAAVAGSANVPLAGVRPYVPDHKVYFAAFDDKITAHYLCGLLNASIIREWIEGHTVSIQVGDVFKHLNVPAYDPLNPAHGALAVLVEQAHAEHDDKLRSVILQAIEIAALGILMAWMPPAS